MSSGMDVASAHAKNDDTLTPRSVVSVSADLRRSSSLRRPGNQNRELNSYSSLPRIRRTTSVKQSSSPFLKERYLKKIAPGVDTIGNKRYAIVISIHKC